MPFTLGYELVGRVDAVGEGVSLAPGARVAALTVYRANADWALVRAEELVPVPDALDAGEAVALVLNYVTAYQMLHRVVEARGGETLAASAAAGGVGTALLQLAKLAGARIFGIASASKRARVEAEGGMFVDRTGDWRAEIRSAAPNGVDAAFDSIGGPFLGKMRTLVRRGGWLVPYGFSGLIQNGRVHRTAGWGTFARAFALYPLIPDGRRVHFYGITARFRKDPAPFREDLAQLFALLGARKIAPVIAARLPLEEIRRAHELVERGEVQGKIVIVN